MKIDFTALWLHFWATLAAILVGLKLTGHSGLDWPRTLSPFWGPLVFAAAIYALATLLALPGACRRYRAKKRAAAR